MGNTDVSRFDVRAFDSVEEHGQGGFRDGRFVGADGGEGGDGETAFVDVVETDDLDLFRDRNALFVQFSQRADGQFVAEAEQSVRGSGGIEELPDGRGGVASGVAGGLAVPGIVSGQAGGADRRTVTLEA